MRRAHGTQASGDTQASGGVSASGEAPAYKRAGVDYETLDAGKRDAIAAALETSGLLAARGGRALDASRGATAFVFELAGERLAFVVEGLGTKSIIARHVYEQLGVNRFADVAYDTVAAILGDLCCVGALPLVVGAYFATGSSDWYRREAPASALLEGWRRACVDGGCTWAGGESPSLSGLVSEQEIELAGSAVGVIPDGVEPILGERLAAGDEIVLVGSSGLHANGASLARMVAAELPDGYATELPSGRSLGEALLDPSVLYAPLVATLLARGIVPTYLSHITGHGLLKLMRSPRRLTYRISELPEVPEVLAFLAQRARLDAHAAYSTFNMGCGFAVCCASGQAAAIIETATQLGLRALLGGVVEDGPRQVLLEPVGVRYAGDELELGARA
jgi:phosphoribosylformylglycinamidine cyclo-ligase